MRGPEVHFGEEPRTGGGIQVRMTPHPEFLLESLGWSSGRPVGAPGLSSGYIRSPPARRGGLRALWGPKGRRRADLSVLSEVHRRGRSGQEIGMWGHHMGSKAMGPGHPRAVSRGEGHGEGTGTELAQDRTPRPPSPRSEKRGIRPTDSRQERGRRLGGGPRAAHGEKLGCRRAASSRRAGPQGQVGVVLRVAVKARPRARAGAALEAEET